MLRMLAAELATAAERRLSDFNPQEVANTAWAFATVNYRDEKLLAALAIAAERRLSAFSLPFFQMALWAFSQREHLCLFHGALFLIRIRTSVVAIFGVAPCSWRTNYRNIIDEMTNEMALRKGLASTAGSYGTDMGFGAAR